MTVSVNALLERDGAKTAIITTEGFRDVLEIGRQARPDLYDLDAEKPAPLIPRKRRYEVAERATPEGIEEPPEGWGQSLRHLGPGLILSASIVGSGELIATFDRHRGVV